MQATTKLEIAILINLCNGDPDICTKVNFSRQFSAIIDLKNE